MYQHCNMLPQNITFANHKATLLLVPTMPVGFTDLVTFIFGPKFITFIVTQPKWKNSLILRT